jgi:cell cycle sensor histidine kinase DivJ
MVSRVAASLRRAVLAAETRLDAFVRLAGADLAAPASRWFVGSRLGLGAAGLAIIPLLLALQGRLDALAGLAMGALVLQTTAGLLAVRAGGHGWAYLLSAMALVAGGAAAAMTGSPATLVALSAFLAVDAVLLESRRAMLAASAVTTLSVAGLAAVGAPAAPGPVIGMLLPLSLVLATSAGLLACLRSTKTRRQADLAAGELRDALAALAGGLLLRLDQTGSATAVEGGEPGCLRADLLLGRGLFDAVHVADRPMFLRSLAAALRDGAPSAVRIRLRTTAADAVPAFAWVDCSTRPDGTGGQLCLLRDASRDMDRQAEVEAAREATESARRQQKRVIDALGHELRNPLTAMLGFAELIGADETVPDGRREQARLIARAARHAEDVIAAVDTWADLGGVGRRVDREACKADLLVRDAVALMRPRAEEAGVTLEACVEEGLPTLFAQPQGVGQVLLNLLDNALRYSPRGGLVRVGARRDRSELVLTVEDRGPGMSADQIARVGEPFARGSGSRAGRGLGLAIASSVMRLHGGRLDITSRPGEGTTVTARLAFCGPAARPDNLVSLPPTRETRAAEPFLARVKKRA